MRSKGYWASSLETATASSVFLQNVGMSKYVLCEVLYGTLKQEIQGQETKNHGNSGWVPEIFTRNSDYALGLRTAPLVSLATPLSSLPDEPVVGGYVPAACWPPCAHLSPHPWPRRLFPEEAPSPSCHLSGSRGVGQRGVCLKLRGGLHPSPIPEIGALGMNVKGCDILFNA